MNQNSPAGSEAVLDGATAATVGPLLTLQAPPPTIEDLAARLDLPVGHDTTAPAGAGEGATPPAPVAKDTFSQTVRTAEADLLKIQQAVRALPGEVRGDVMRDIQQMRMVLETEKRTLALYKKHLGEESQEYLDMEISAEHSILTNLSMLHTSFADANVDLNNALGLARSGYANRGTDASALLSRLTERGTLWITENAGSLTADQAAEASRYLTTMADIEPQWQKALADGDLELANDLKLRYDAASRPFLELKLAAGKEVGKRRWNGYYTKSGEWVSDTSGVLVWAQILVPLVTTGLTLGMTMHENEKTRKWTEEQKEEEREHQMALTQLRGEQALALQGVANEGSGTASVGASSGVSSLGGSFQTA